MLKKHLKLMALAVVSITLHEKIVAGDHGQSNHHAIVGVVARNQFDADILDLAPSIHYSGVSYDINRKETDEERARYYAAISLILNNRCIENVESDQGEQKELLFIHIPSILSASSLSVIPEEGSHDSDNYSIDSNVTDNRSKDVNVGIFYDDQGSSCSIQSLCREISCMDYSQMSGSTISLDAIDGLDEDDFGIALLHFRNQADNETRRFYELGEVDSALYLELSNSKVPFNTPQDNSPKSGRSNDGNQA